MSSEIIAQIKEFTKDNNKTRIAVRKYLINKYKFTEAYARQMLSHAYTIGSLSDKDGICVINEWWNN